MLEDGVDITNHDDLMTAAARVGIERDEKRRWLHDGKGDARVDGEVADAYATGLRGVCKFIKRDRV